MTVTTDRDALKAQRNFLANASVDADLVNEFLYGPYGGSSDRRFTLFAAWAGKVAGEKAGRAFWCVVEEQWPSFDKIGHRKAERLFEKFAKQWRPTDALLRLPSEIRVYRGQSAHAPLGLSWTLDRQVAEGFARGHRGIPVRSPVVYEIDVAREKIAMLLTDRDEAEVVLRTAML